MDNQNNQSNPEIKPQGSPAMDKVVEVKPKIHIPDVQDPADSNLCDSCQ
jgi:hypothetical protein